MLSTGNKLRPLLAIALSIAMMLATVTPALATSGTIAGAGANWFVGDNFRTTNGLPAGGSCTVGSNGSGAGVNDAQIPGQGDPFDFAVMYWVGNTQVGGALSITSPTSASFSPVSIAGLNVQLKYDALTSSRTMRAYLSLTNPTAAPVSVPVIYVNNFGSDGSTVIKGSSSGDITFTTSDQWLVTDDFSSTSGDPTNTTVLYGPGAQVAPSSVSQTVFNCAGTQGTQTSYNIIIPAGQTRALMMFQQLSSSSAIALANASMFNTTPIDPSLVAGLNTTEINQVLNWTSNQPPTANAGGSYSGDEVSAIAMSGASASDPDLDTLIYAWGVDSALCSFDNASLLNPNLTCSDNGNFIATLTVSDGVNSAVSSDASVTVDNVAPTLGAISVDQVLVPVNTAINATADFTDPGTLDTHTVSWDWGDGTSVGTVTQGAGFGSVNNSHSYSTPGVYTVKLTVTDNDGDVSNESAYQFVVVYDPNGGFVTGGGWINSPAGAYTADPSLSGKANFGFVAKYKKGANVPDGNTQFQFKAGDLNFHSSSYEWLVVAGNKAQFKGEGTINGQGSYKFMITADDDNPDTFRIHIWDDNGTVYDNGSQQSLGGGSIVIHK